MRQILTIFAVLLLTGCASEPEGSAANIFNTSFCKEDYSSLLCVPAAIVLLPVTVGATIGDGLKNNPAIGQAIAETLANTNVYSDRVKTPNGTYDVNSVCSFGSCDTTVKKR